jgi:hypothetical protein
MITWLNSIHRDLESAEYMIETSGFGEFQLLCNKIAKKSLQHFIYTRTGKFPQDDDLIPLFQHATHLENKLEGYTVGIQMMAEIEHTAIPHGKVSYPEGTTRKHYLDFCRELLLYIIKLLDN